MTYEQILTEDYQIKATWLELERMREIRIMEDELEITRRKMQGIGVVDNY